jgi:2,5-diketo-D-gluconate reductase A
MALAPTITLNNGVRMPQLGLGTWPLTDDSVVHVLLAALAAGYRHIDTAVAYGNERGVGRAIHESGIRREELFVTTKLDGNYQGNDRAIAGLEESLQRLGLGYVDLLLIHWPMPQRDQYRSTWATFEKLQAAGLAHSIGVSNFKPAHLDRLLASANIVPVVNQIQLNPQITRPDHRTYHQAHGIATVAWGPLAPGTTLLEHTTLTELAAKYGKTPAQIVLRWHIELGNIAIPKSADPVRIAQNLAVFDFTLSSNEIAAITAIDTGAVAGVDSDTMGH